MTDLQPRRARDAISPELDRGALDDLYGDYADLLDEDRLEAWLELFAATCEYRAVARENWVRGLPLSTMWCETRGMLADRVMAIRQTVMHIPRTLRHLVGRPRPTPAGAGAARPGGELPRWSVQASFVVTQTLAGEPTTLFAAGRYHDDVVLEGGRLCFASKVAVYDSDLVPNSLIYPL